MPEGLKAHAGRLAKLFRVVMSATLAGEVMNARDAILHILEGEQQDFHDLANVLLLGLEPPKKIVVAPPSVDRPACDIAAWCIVQLELNPQLPCEPRERAFLNDMSQRWGAPTEKQATWLAAIHNRLIRHGARHA